MARKLNQIMKAVGPKRQKKILRRAKELIAEEMSLREIRQSCRVTQVQMAKLLGVGQDSVSRLETRDDILISTIQAFAHALGGTLSLVVELPGRNPIKLGKGNQKRMPSIHIED